MSKKKTRNNLFRVNWLNTKNGEAEILSASETGIIRVRESTMVNRVSERYYYCKVKHMLLYDKIITGTARFL